MSWHSQQPSIVPHAQLDRTDNYGRRRQKIWFRADLWRTTALLFTRYQSGIRLRRRCCYEPAIFETKIRLAAVTNRHCVKALTVVNGRDIDDSLAQDLWYYDTRSKAAQQAQIYLTTWIQASNSRLPICMSILAIYDKPPDYSLTAERSPSRTPN